MAAILFKAIFCQFIFFPVSSSREPTTNGTEGGADDCAEQITRWAGKFAHQDSIGKGLMWAAFHCTVSNHLSKISVRNYKNIEGYTAHIIVSWPNPKQWQMGHTSNLMMMMRSSTGILTIVIKKWVSWIHNDRMLDNVSLFSALCIVLTHWGRDKMDAISWMKMFEYRLKFHWSLFLRVHLTISQHWFT